MKLKMWSCEVDVVIAETVGEAICVTASLHGKSGNVEESLQTIEDAYGCDQKDYHPENWTEHTPEANLKINYVDEGIVVEKTVQEWIDENGKGYFACTEY